MTGDVYLASYVCLGGAALLFLYFIRARLKKMHPELFASLGSPTFQDSNISHDAWRFQKFVWWGYLSAANDNRLQWLCAFASISQCGVLILFFYDIWQQLKLHMGI
jgi:hypothetical protein